MKNEKAKTVGDGLNMTTGKTDFRLAHLLLIPVITFYIIIRQIIKVLAIALFVVCALCTGDRLK